MSKPPLDEKWIVGLQSNAPGETVCGDTFTVITRDNQIIIALADGLGHGHAAALAANTFCDYCRLFAADNLHRLMMGGHEALRGTRGAAAALVKLDYETYTMDFIGVGNIELKAASRVPITPVCATGVVGGRLKSAMVYSYPISPDDLLVLYSDGLRGIYDLDSVSSLPAKQIAEKLMQQYRKHDDDASCVVVRVRLRTTLASNTRSLVIEVT